MQIAAYEFKEGARFQSGAYKNPKEVGAHLELLRQQQKGELTPQDVVSDAKHSNSPLHSYFEWDDSAAAEQYRLKQARGLIKAVVAVYTDTDKPARRMSAFVHVNESGAPHYRDTAHALAQTNTREIVLRQAWREFQSFRKKYADLQEFAVLFETADKLSGELKLTSDA